MLRSKTICGNTLSGFQAVPTNIPPGLLESPQDRLNVEPVVDDVPVLYRVVLAFEAEFSRFLAFHFAAKRDEILVPHHFSPDKAALDVAVNLSRGFTRRGSPLDGPGFDFIFSR